MQVRETTCRVICGGAEGAVSVVLVTGDERRADGVVLSPRELEVIEGVAEGRSDKEIADGLGVEPSTVKTLLSRARTKLGARTRAEAVALAVRSELIR